MNKKTRSLITCDFDGKILFFDKSAENMFGFLNYEVIGIKRFYNLLHFNSITSFIKKIDNFVKSNDTFLEDSVFCLHKNESCFSVFLKIKKKKKLILLNVTKKIFNYSDLEKKLSFEKLSIILRTKFIIGSIMPYIFSIFWSLKYHYLLSYSILVLLFLALVFFHIAANTFNDYFDWKSGRDQINLDYVLFSTGGSRSIDLKLISEKKLLFLSISFIFIVSIIGIYLISIRGVKILILGLIGFFSVYFYSAPPIHLASRYGLGELMHIICLGPLIVYGSVFALIGHSNYIDFLVGLPFGLLITSCLLINEYPDSKYDKISKKMNLAVIIGYKYIPYLFSILIISAFLIIIYSILTGILSLIFLFIFLTLYYSYITIRSVFNISKEREFVITSCFKSINLYLYFSLIYIGSLILELLLS